MPLYITENQVEQILSMQTAIAALVEVFKARALGKAFNTPRKRLPTSSGAYNFMSATWTSHNIAGHKSYAAGKAGISFHVMLYDTSSNTLLAVIEANRMGQIRTGAASGVATKYMASARPSMTAGIIGSGYQAETQLEAIANVRNITQAKVFSRSKENRTNFANKMSHKLNIEVIPVESAQEAAQANIIATITSSVQPVLNGEWIQPGTHINAAGNNSWMKREIDTNTIANADIIAVDDIDQAKTECGELMRAAETGRFSWDNAIPIHNIINSRTTRRSPEATMHRTSLSQITLFESQGIALEDIAVCEKIYQTATQQGIGMKLP